MTMSWSKRICHVIKVHDWIDEGKGIVWERPKPSSEGEGVTVWHIL